MKKSLRYNIQEIVNEEFVIIYGAGNYGKFVLEELQKQGNIIYGFCDENEEKIGTEYCSIRVFSIDELLELKENFTYVVTVVNAEEKRVITRRLKNRGISDRKIVIPLPNVKSKFYDNGILYYEDYLKAIVWNKFQIYKNSNRQFHEIFITNNIKKIGFLGNGIISAYFTEELRDSFCEAIILKDEDIVKLNTNRVEVIVITNPLKLNYYEEQILRIIDVPILNILEIIR